MIIKNKSFVLTQRQAPVLSRMTNADIVMKNAKIMIHAHKMTVLSLMRDRLLLHQPIRNQKRVHTAPNAPNLPADLNIQRDGIIVLMEHHVQIHDLLLIIHLLLRNHVVMETSAKGKIVGFLIQRMNGKNIHKMPANRNSSLKRMVRRIAIQETCRLQPALIHREIHHL